MEGNKINKQLLLVATKVKAINKDNIGKAKRKDYRENNKIVAMATGKNLRKTLG